MRLLQRRRAHRAQIARHRAPQNAFIDQPRDFAQGMMLLDHVGRTVNGSREHTLPRHGDRLLPQRHDVEAFHVINDGQHALRRDDAGIGWQMLVTGGKAGDEVDRLDANGAQSFVQRRAMVYHIMRAHPLHPFNRFRPRSRGDDAQFGQLPGKLHQHRTDPARAVHDQYGLPLTPAARHAQPVEQQFPCGQSRERQRRRLREID